MKKFFSLLAAVLFAGSMMAETVEIAAGTFDGKGGNYTEGWTTTGTGVSRNDCVVVGAGENITSPTVDLSAYESVIISIKARRFGSLSGSKAVIAVTLGGQEVGTVEASGTSATTALEDIEYTLPAGLTGGAFVFTCTNATSVGSTHGAGINSIVIKGVTGGVTPPEPTAEYYLVGNFNNWQANAAYKFAANPNNAAEMMLAGVELSANDSIKVLEVLGDSTIWYPDNAGNYVVAADGEYDIYFRADGQGGDDWYYHYFYVAKKVIPTYTCAQVQANEATEAGYLNEVQVLFVRNANVYVKDATGMTQVYLANNGLAIGDVVSGIKGTSTVYKSTPEFVPSNAPADWTIAHGEAPAYEEKAEVPTTGNVNGVYKFMNVTFAEAPAYSTESAVNATATIGESTIVIRDNYKFGPSLEANKAYDIVALVVIYNNAAQLYFISATEAAAPYVPTLADGFYLVGNQLNNWTPAAAYHLVGNPDNAAEFMVTATLVEGDSLKVVNVVNDAITAWYPDNAPNYVVDAAHAGEKTIYFRPDGQGGDKWFYGVIYIDENPAPFVCDWANIDFLGSAVPAYANQFKLCKEGEYPGVVNVQESFGTEAGIYVTFPSAAFGQISLAEGQYAIQGAGMLLYVSAFTALETEVTVVCENNPIVFTVYNAAYEPQPEYYLAGNMTNWTVIAEDAYKFVANPEAEGEYMLNYTLVDTMAIKVVKVEGENQTWYPEALDKAFIVGETYAGEKTIYFRPDGQGGEGWHEGVIYVAPNDKPIVDLGPWKDSWFGDANWATETDSYIEYDAQNEKATVHIGQDKTGQWHAQAKYQGVIAEEGKCYHLALKMKANHAVSGVTLKWQDNNNAPNMIYMNQSITLAENVEWTIDTIVAGVALSYGDNGELLPNNGIMVIDFGWAHTGDVIEIYAVVTEEVACPEVPEPETNYYLVGTMTNWTVVAEAQYLFVANEAIEGEYVLETTLTENQGIKVVGVKGEAQTWYIEGMGNEYIVDAAHAGQATIYFRPVANSEWTDLGGHIYVDKTNGIDNTAIEAQAIKRVENGTIIIEKNGVKYTVFGQIVK